MSKKKSGKRILSVTLKRMVDDSPDTSYLGEYSNREETEYAIDRANSEDCASVRSDAQEAKEKLERIASHVYTIRIELGKTFGDRFSEQDKVAEWEALAEEEDMLSSLAEELTECDCNFSGHWNAREYRYFNPNYKNYEGLPEEDIRKYCRQDFDRMESLNSGQWCYIGIRAEACIATYDAKGMQGTMQRITSGSLWGVESDSRSYIAEVE